MAQDRIVTEQELEHISDNLPGWTADQKTGIKKSFTFKDFPEAFAFMTRVAFLAERENHHPDWSNSYNRVSIALVTHDAGGVTQKDVALAQAIEALVGD